MTDTNTNNSDADKPLPENEHLYTPDELIDELLDEGEIDDATREELEAALDELIEEGVVVEHPDGTIDITSYRAAMAVYTKGKLNIQRRRAANFIGWGDDK